MRRRALIGTLAVLTLGAAVAVAAVGGGGTAAKPKLLFADEFTARGIDHSHWQLCHWWSPNGCTIATNHELEWYLPRQAHAGDGTLRLRATRHAIVRAGQRYPFTSGMISSGPGREGPSRFAFTYGRAEMRARLPAGRGLWPAFWMLPADRESLPEIDIMESTGDTPEEMSMHVHYRRADGTVAAPGRRVHDLAPGWHRFAVDWSPGSLRWSVDGRERWRVTGPAVPAEPMYLVANLAVGGDEPGPPDAATHFPAQFVIDWIRVTR
ncbi:MAG: hypothetical protein QOF76_3376 [Solirubrobacteraceae bacterium]|nr:hypothetical protein [Solirubrobacteraceae bacterium]